MSDKPLVQQALAVDLALLTLDVRPKIKDARSNGRVARFHSAMSYLRGFWDAIVREWSGLDRLRCVVVEVWQSGGGADGDPSNTRLDKFYLLIRRFIHAGFLLLKREQWDPRAIDLYNDLLTGPGGPLQSVSLPLPSLPKRRCTKAERISSVTPAIPWPAHAAPLSCGLFPTP